MINILYADSGNEWNDIVKSFTNWDIYYLNEYLYSLKLHGQGEPILFYYTDKSCRICYVAMKRDVADDSRFSDHLEKGTYFDIETPYGYGGPIAEGNVNDASIKQFWKGVFEFARDNRIVTQFICIHPLLRNEIKLDIACDRVMYLKDTIMIDTSSKNAILENMDSKTRKEKQNKIK